MDRSTEHSSSLCNRIDHMRRAPRLNVYKYLRVPVEYTRKQAKLCNLQAPLPPARPPGSLGVGLVQLLELPHAVFEASELLL